MQQAQYGDGGGAAPRKKGGAKEFMALLGGSPSMPGAVIPAGAEFPPSLTDAEGLARAAAAGGNGMGDGRGGAA